MIENKILESKAIVRFQDCDPFNHLNNAAYLNYLVNAREDQLMEAYGINIY
ncbi:thioesterase, partial [Flavobacteriaceae bacterium]|nr:thioesterase [Flavobacteriaceae bacterium]